MLVLALFTVLLAVLAWKYISCNQKLPPGPIRWPLVGCIPEMLFYGGIYSFNQLGVLRKRYGDIFSVGLGTHYGIVISSLEMMNDLFKRPETIERFEFELVKERQRYKNLGISFARGDIWAQNRKFTMKTLRDFGFGKTGSMEDSIYEEMNVLLSDIHTEVTSTGSWEPTKERTALIASNILWMAVGGYRFDNDDPLATRQIELITEAFQVFSPTNPLIALPWLKYIPGIAQKARRQGELLGELEQLNEELVEDVKQRRGERSEPDNFIEFFLDKIEKEKGNPNSNMNREQLTMILGDISFGGTDTPAGVMLWIILYFVLNQDVQKRARKEIAQVSNHGKRRITATEVRNMPYLRACLLEVTRHCPFMTTPGPRVASHDITYGKYVIPKGTCLMANLYEVFHDQTLWGDPYNFRPERFLNNEGKLDPTIVEMVPVFGFGKRMCPAEIISWDILNIFTVALLSNVHLDVIPGRKPTVDPGMPSLTIGPKPFVVGISQASLDLQ